MSSHAVVFVLILIVNLSLGANILFLNGGISPSHHIYNRVLVLGLAAKGHNVTFVSPDVSKDVKPNVHYVYLEKVYDSFYSELQDNDIMLDFAHHSAHRSIIEFVPMCAQTCRGILASKGLEDLLNYPKDFKFDVIINDITFGPCLLPLITRFNNPTVISLTAFANPLTTTDYIGGHKYPGYIPHWSVTYPNVMSFFERIHNVFLFFVDWMSRERLLYPQFEELVRDRFKFDFPTLKELSLTSSLMLVNTDNAINNPEPLQPNMIQVGGLQINEPKPLPKEIDDFIKSGKGTVLMSLGTNIKSVFLGKERLKSVLETFAQLPDYNFLWKFEAEVEDLPIKPTKNVMVGKFLPQSDILAHPNLVAFVTHSGMLSTHEAYWRGKPMIAVPFFADQLMNSAKAIKLGVGVSVDFRKLSTTFKTQIETVVNNPSYLVNAKKISKLFQDKPSKPLDTAVWWIEYAIRNPNLDHLKSPTVSIGWLVSNSYDIMLVALAIVIILLYTICRVISGVKNLFGGSNKTKRKAE